MYSFNFRSKNFCNVFDVLQNKIVANVSLWILCERHLSPAAAYTRAQSSLLQLRGSLFPRRSYLLLSRNGEMYSPPFASSYFPPFPFYSIFHMLQRHCSRRIQTYADTELHTNWIYNRRRAERQLKSVTIYSGENTVIQTHKMFDFAYLPLIFYIYRIKNRFLDVYFMLIVKNTNEMKKNTDCGRFYLFFSVFVAECKKLITLIISIYIY